MNRYNPQDIEPKWQQIWADTKLYQAQDGDKSRPKYYMLTEFPYPSGDGLHAGHAREYTLGDVIARHKRMLGHNVLFPMGWDAFGLPTENYAIKHKIKPQDATKANTDTFRRQMKSLGFSFDWDREINTTDPDYYKWTQWLFLQFLSRDLAYQAEIPINWCPKEKTGLANEEVVNGVHERCGTPVEKKTLKQWMLKITAYADRLIDGLKTVDYPPRIADQQVNWIGRSEGAEIDFTVGTHYEKLGPKVPKIVSKAKEGEAVTVYTTRPDTLGGATFLVLAPEHPAVAKITTPAQKDSVDNYVKAAQRETELERQETERPKTGVFTGAYTENPITRRPMPIWVADYVLAGYGTGAIMAVPAHDDRDFAFAQAMNEHLGYGGPQSFVDGGSPPRPGLEFHEREVVQAIVKHPTEQKFLLLELTAWEDKAYSYPMGGVDDGESPTESALRELAEETGYDHIAHASPISSPYFAEFYHQHKKVNRRAHIHNVFIELSDLHQSDVDPHERALHQIHWLPGDEVVEKVFGDGAKKLMRDYLAGRTTPAIEIIPVVEPVTGLIHSGKESEKQAIVAVVRDPKTKRVIMLDWGPRQANWGGTMFIGGGVEPGETDLIAAAKREIAEETGYIDVELIRQSDVQVHNHYFSNPKRRYDLAHMTPLLFELQSDKNVPTALDENEKGLFKVVWVDEAEVLDRVEDPGHELVYRLLHDGIVYTGEGPLINSGQFDGLTGTDAKHAIVKFLYDQGLGRHATKYRLRDWIFSRQHYWGEPIPVIHCPKDGIVPVPDDQLPVKLPEVEHYEPTDTGESPLAAISDWVNVKCPKCGGPAKRETDTMPNWAGSSWYYLRYMDPHNDKAFADPAKLKYWGEVDLYLGGMEHTTLHLLYSRFWHQFLYDQKLVPTSEPYAARRGQGIVLAADGRKMSKSIGNVINPTDIIARYGADAFRLYIMFMAPYDETTPWSDERLNGVSRFLYRAWNLIQLLIANGNQSSAEGTGELTTAIDRQTHKTLKKVHDDLGGMRFNTMVSTLMEYVNYLSEAKTKATLTSPAYSELAQRTARALILMLAPAAPHLAEELWHELGEEGSVHVAPWPAYDPKLIEDDLVTVIVQVNGKLRGQIIAAPDTPEAELTATAKADPNVAKYLHGATIVKTIVVPRKLVNFVVKA